MRKFLLYGSLILLALLIAAGIAGNIYLERLAPRARKQVVQALQERFDADVDLKSLDLSLSPEPKVVGQGLSIRHKEWNDPKPLISVVRFTAKTSLADLLFQTYKVDSVQLEGLEIDLPPRGSSSIKRRTTHDNSQLRFVIKTLVANGAVLQVEPKVPGKDPLRFDIEKLTMHSVGPGKPMTFNTSLQNPKPPGLINSKGKFGPWQKDDPRSTPVSGSYTFQNADLGIFKGISGILASTGAYDGVLQRIEVNGATDTPDFALKRGGAPVHLETTFNSVVDGTNGDTVLNQVDAHFLHSEFICRGGVVQQAGEKGKTIDLDAVTKNARMEDILELVLGDKKRILTGTVDFKSKIIIPPGKEAVLDKLNLQGEFKILSGQFASNKIEQRLKTLSDRARGVTKEEEDQTPAQTVASNFVGRFKLEKGRASFLQFSFQVPGAEIKLAGDYNLRSQKIDMKGVFRMQATLADTQSGIKHWLLKPLDPFFEKDGAGFQVPLQITGTREHPDVQVLAFHHRFNMK
jgi:hypothetical protein